MDSDTNDLYLCEEIGDDEIDGNDIAAIFELPDIPHFGTENVEIDTRNWFGENYPHKAGTS